MQDAQAASAFAIEPLTRLHTRAAFACGNEALDRYLREQARREQERRVARVYVLRHIPTERVAGYHALAASAVETRGLPEEIAHRLSRYPVQPVLLLGRLARDLHFRGEGVGELLLRDALYRCLEAQRGIGAIAVIVDAIDERATSFYQAYGFIKLPGAGGRLFIAMETIERAAGPAIVSDAIEGPHGGPIS